MPTYKEDERGKNKMGEYYPVYSNKLRNRMLLMIIQVQYM